MKKSVMGFLVIFVVILAPGLVIAQCGVPANCTIPAQATVCPTGDIPVVSIIRDINNAPCPGSTITMSVNANCLCGSVTTYTAVTNNQGMVVFNPALGGCCNSPGLISYTDASGVVLGTTDAVNSPDMDGSCLVNLVDISLFSVVFFGVYAPCADFNWDGVINLTDISIFVQHLGH